MRRAIGILLVLCLVTSAASGVQDGTSVTEQVMGAPAQPTWGVMLPDECTVADVLWNADSSRAFVSMSVRAVDVWQLLVRFWPETLAIAAGLPLLIILLLLLRRRWLRRRVVAIGEPHCRSCSYQLTGRTDAKVCPECGHSLNKRSIVFGRPMRRWPVVVMASLLLFVGGAYFVVHRYVPRANTVPYYGSVWNWFHWPSVRLYNWATAHRYWSLTFPPSRLVRIVEIDPATGQVTHTILNTPLARNDGTRLNTRLFPGRDPDRAYMMSQQSVREIDLRSGRTVREFRLPPGLGDPRIGISEIALHPSRPVLYAYVDYLMVGQWDLGTGDWTLLASYPKRSRLLMYSLFPIIDADTVILRRALDDHADESGFDLIDLNTLETAATFRKPKDESSQVIGAADGGLLYTDSVFGGPSSTQVTGQTILRWSPGMDEPEEVLAAPVRRIVSVVVGRSGRLYLSGDPIQWGRGVLPIVAVFDHQTGKYLDPLQSPRNADMDLSISPDEHWAITFHSEPTTGPGLFIFDLHAIHGDAPGK